jgi:hypothetical protein
MSLMDDVFNDLDKNNRTRQSNSNQSKSLMDDVFNDLDNQPKEPTYQEPIQEPIQQPKEDKKGFFGTVGGMIGAVGKDMGTGIKHLGYLINPFDDVGMSDIADMTREANKKNEQDEDWKNAANLVHSVTGGATFGGLQNPEYIEPGAINIAGTIGGAFVPGGAIASGLRGTRLGANVAPQMNVLQKGFQYGKEGMVAGAAYGAIDETAQGFSNPEDFNLADSAKRIGIDATIGAVGDPLIMGAVGAIGQGARRVWNSDAIQNQNAFIGRNKDIGPMNEPDRLRPEQSKSLMDDVLDQQTSQQVPYNVLRENPINVDLPSYAPTNYRVDSSFNVQAQTPSVINARRANPEPIKVARKANDYQVPQNDNVIVYRRDTQSNFSSPSVRPHGLYMSMVDDLNNFRTPFEDVGDSNYWSKANPRNPLVANETVVNHRRFGLRGSGEASAGVASLKQLVSDNEFNRLLSMNKQQLIDELNVKFPGPDYTRYYDSYELLEAYAGQLARQRGFDSIILRDSRHPEFSEMTILQDDILGELSSTRPTFNYRLNRTFGNSERVQNDTGMNPTNQSYNLTRRPIAQSIEIQSTGTQPQQNMLPNIQPQRVDDAISEQINNFNAGKSNINIADEINRYQANLNDNVIPLVPQAGTSRQRQFIDTYNQSSKAVDEVSNQLDGRYQVRTNQEVVNIANRIVGQDLEEAVSYFKRTRRDPQVKLAVGMRLVDEFQTQGNFQRASEIVEELAEMGTQAGRNVQMFSVYNRLTPQGVLVHAQRLVKATNEMLPPGKEVKLTSDMAAKLTDTANTIQTMKGQNLQANNVMNIMQKVKQGNALTDVELQTVRSFVEDARKFIGDVVDTKPQRPKLVKDTRSRDKVVDFFAKQEELAKQRIAKRRNAANSLPLDLYYDYAVVGASKVAKGIVKFSDFAEEMVKEFGEEIRPYMQQIYNKAVDTFNLQTDSVTRRKLSEAEKVVNKAIRDNNITTEEAEVIRQAAKQLADKTGDARIEASMELQATLQLLARPTFGEKISTTQVIMQLFNPKTIIRNILGNELFYRAEQLSKLIAVPIDIIQSTKTGTRTIFFKSGNQGEYWRNWLRGAKSGWNRLNPEGLQTQYDLNTATFQSKVNPLYWLEKALGASLRSFDYAGYKRAYNKQLGQMAKSRAYSEGYRGIELNTKAQEYMLQYDDNLASIADQYGKYATFQDNTALSMGLQRIKRALNFNKDFGLGDLVLRYPKTPGNLIMRALEYSPMGFFRSANILLEPRFKKVPYRSEEFARSLARAITGTMGFSGLGYILAEKGVLTSPGNSDYETNSLEREAGIQSNSVNITALDRFLLGGFNLNDLERQQNDLFISFDWAQPVAMSVILGTAIDQSIQEEGELNLPSAIKTGVEGATNAMIDMSVLRGLKDATTFYPGQSVADKGMEIIAGLPSSFAPTLGNQVNQLMDNSSRNTYDPSLLQKSMNQATRKIPGLSQSLPQSYTTMGEPRETFQDRSNNFLNVFFNPAFVNRYNPSPEAQFVIDFINQTGDTSVAPRYAPKTITLDGEKITLTGEQYVFLQRRMGEETSRMLQEALPSLQGTNNEEKIRRELDSILREAGEIARNDLRNELQGR